MVLPTRKISWCPNASFHITARGNHRNDIFKDEEDFGFYLTLVEEALKYYDYEDYKVICYCLMNNHIHLLVKTTTSPPGRFIGRINARYAKYFNKKYNYIGHLFQDRYHSEIIESDTQMLETSRYIHLNPIRANMVEKPEDYKWSSFKIYIGKIEEKLICSNLILDYFTSKNKRHAYKAFVYNGIKEKYVLRHKIKRTFIEGEEINGISN